MIFTFSPHTLLLRMCHWTGFPTYMKVFSHRGRYAIRVPARNVTNCCVASPTKKEKEKKRFWNKSTTGSTLPLYISCISYVVRTTFRNSAVSPATPIQKRTTRRSSLNVLFYHSVAKQQQHSCPLRSATLSLKFENMVQEG